MTEQQPTVYTLWCLVIGEDVPFPVDIEPNKTFGELKKTIKSKIQHQFDDFDAMNLTLFEVNASGETGSVRLSAAKMKIKELRPEDALDPVDELCEKFTSVPAEATIHIAVQPPNEILSLPTSNLMKRMKPSSGSLRPSDEGPVRKKPRIEERRGSRHSGSSDIAYSSIWCPRQDTVSGVLNLLHKHRVVQVRGTPASGKTTLMHLLHAHIVKKYPEAKVIVHKNWPKSELNPFLDEARLKEKLPGYSSFTKEARYFLFDEGQTTYWDRILWKAFKDTIQPTAPLGLDNPVYAILFCRYGNENVRDPQQPTPIDLREAKVTLDRIDRDGFKPFGLLLDESEYRDVIERYPKLLLKDDLRDYIYRLTRGHVGAVLAVADYLIKKREKDMVRRIPSGLEDFDEDNPTYGKLCEHLYKDNRIGRGLPETPALYAQAMRSLLKKDSIYFYDENVDASIHSCLHDSYRNGYVNLDQENWYTFASPLHQQLWSWLLLPERNYQLPYDDIYSFVLDTVSRFKPSQLTGSNRRVGALKHRPPEAQYQQEYYRCASEVTGGNIILSPEYVTAVGTRSGRIDFFIESKQWGIELTRDGSRLNEHNSRFQVDGAYEQWLEKSQMLDYVLLDFRNTEPKQAHPGIKNLYHIVFNSETTFEIYGNDRKMIERRNLMQHH